MQWNTDSILGVGKENPLIAAEAGDWRGQNAVSTHILEREEVRDWGWEGQRNSRPQDASAIWPLLTDHQAKPGCFTAQKPLQTSLVAPLSEHHLTRAPVILERMLQRWLKTEEEEDPIPLSNLPIHRGLFKRASKQSRTARVAQAVSLPFSNATKGAICSLCLSWGISRSQFSLLGTDPRPW